MKKTLVQKLVSFVPCEKRRNTIRYWFRHIFLWERWRSFVLVDGGAPVQLDMGRHPWHDDYCADPFLFRHYGANWIFYETLDKKGKGVLGCFKEVDGKWIQQGKVLELPCHLSYPQVFEEGGHVYMIPESYARGRGGVHVFEAVDFPLKWERRATLFSGGYVDSTLLRENGHYYLACDLIDRGERPELWHADSLFGRWSRHPEPTPILNSPRLRRCAGAYQRENGHLYRLAQDCNGAYGKRVFRVPVLEASPTVYREGQAELILDRIFMGENLARHTFNTLKVGDNLYEVFDVRDYVCQQPMKILVGLTVFVRTALAAVWRRI